MKASDLLQQILQNRRARAVGPDASAPPLPGAPAPLVEQSKGPSLAASGIIGAVKGTVQHLATQGADGDQGERDDFRYGHIRRTAEQQQGSTTGPFAAENPTFGRPTAPRPSVDRPVEPPRSTSERPAFGTPESVRTRFGRLPGYRGGGAMPAGRPAVVGEEEPEVVVPKEDVVALPVSRLLKQVAAGLGSQPPVQQVAPVPEAGGRPSPVDPATGKSLADLGIPDDAEALPKLTAGVPGADASYAGEGAPSASRAILDSVEALRAQRDHAASREVRDDDGRLKSAGKAALYGGLGALAATGDWRAAAAGAATGAGLGAIRPQTDDQIERMREVEGYDQKITRAGEQATQAVELEGKLSDIEDRRAKREEDGARRADERRSRATDLLLKLFSEAESYDPAIDTPLKRRADALGIDLPAKTKKEDGEPRYQADGALVLVRRDGSVKPVMGADGNPFVDPSKKMVTEDGLQVTQSEALNYRAHKSESEARRGERADDRRREDERRAHEDRVKALEAEVDRERALEAEADKAEGEIREAMKSRAGAAAALSTAEQHLGRLRKQREDDDDSVSASDILEAEKKVDEARTALTTLRARVGELSDRNDKQYPGLFEPDSERWSSRRVKGRLTENAIRLQGLRWNKSDAEIQATVEDARRRGLLR